MFRALERMWLKSGLGTIPPVVELSMKYGGAIILAVIITKAIERPSLRLRDHLFPAQRSTAETDPVTANA
ncbi:hypothetical protein [Cupriavidus basilensis]|nr:hypothetical protein [Cupriavidus basilensis]